MCLIIVSPPGTTPDRDNLCEATWDNPNGSGWMMRAPHGLEIVRSSEDIDHVWATFWSARTRWPDVWAVWHSRLSTQGHDCDDNTHPFRVPGQPWAIAHNGILPLNDGPFDGRDRSDSRILAEDILSETTWTTILAEQERIECWLQGDKVVILSERKERGGPCLILNEGNGMWDKADGCWYSRRSQPYRCSTCNRSYRRCECPSKWKSSQTTGYASTGDPRDWASTSQAALTVASSVLNDDDEDDAKLDEYIAWWEAQDAKERETVAALVDGWDDR